MLSCSQKNSVGMTLTAADLLCLATPNEKASFLFCHKQEIFMVSERIKELIQEMPKDENRVHIEGSILGKVCFRLAEKKGLSFPINRWKN